MPSALALLGLFFIQLVVGFVFRNDEPSAIATLTTMAWVYIALAVIVLLWNRRFITDYIKVGLLNRPAPDDHGGAVPATVASEEL
ncbi:MAG: hypothetical protein DLM69_01600 [Candidatus Chloroheliales bacterium]|nr:MAG: hypothetical protein DLM69_01600 [Chloroflexota bacterium]